MVTTILSDFFSFDFSKAFDSVSHNILCSKLKQVSTNPYSVNWLISFLDQRRKQRVVVDGYRTEYVSVNEGVPQDQIQFWDRSYLLFLSTISKL